MLAVTISADNFTGGLGSAAFVAYLSSLCNNAFTGTQYALLTSLMAAGRTVLSSGGGWLADQMDWVSFFIITTGLAIPGLLRSEEHTSELQSLMRISYAVFCLKKKL